jgi:hypothetical protein
MIFAIIILLWIIALKITIMQEDVEVIRNVGFTINEETRILEK